MVKIATSFLALASLICATLAATPLQTETDVLTIAKDVKAYDDAVSSFPVTGANISHTHLIFNTSRALTLAIKQGTVDLTPLTPTDEHLSEADAKVIISTVESFEPALIHALTALTAKKPIIVVVDDSAAAPNATTQGILEFELNRLHNATNDFEAALSAAVPADLKQNATAFKQATEAVFLKAIATYDV